MAIEENTAGTDHEEAPAGPAQSVDRSRRDLNAVLAHMAYECGRGHAAHQPIEVFLQVASGCNLDCYMCSEHNRPQEWRFGRGLLSLDPKLYEKLEREIFPLAQRLTIGVGGEPMISRHFLDYLERAKAAGLDVHVMTNGTRINTDKRAEALARCASSLEISIDAATPESYERIRHGAKLISLVRNIHRLNAYRSRATEGGRTHLTLCFVLMKSNVHEFPLFVDLARHVDADRVSGWHVISMTEDSAEESLQGDRARSNAYLAEAVRRGEALGIEVDVPRPFELGPGESSVEVEVPEYADVVAPDFLAMLAEPGAASHADREPDDSEVFEFADQEESAPPPEPSGEATISASSEECRPEGPAPAAGRVPEIGGITREALRRAATSSGRIHCASPTNSVFVFFDGRVLPCCHPHSHVALEMGNLHEQDFAEIWNSDLYRNLREGLYTGDAPPMCQNCSIVHSPPPKEERLEDQVGPGKDLASWYAGRQPTSVDDEGTPSWVIEALAPRWHGQHRTIELLATERRHLADHAEALVREREHLHAHIGNLGTHVAGLERASGSWQGRAEEMERAVDAHALQAAELLGERKHLLKHIGNLDERIAGLGKHAANLELALSHWRDRVMMMKREIESHLLQAAELLGERKHLHEHIDNLTGHIGRIEHVLRRIRGSRQYRWLTRLDRLRRRQ